MNGAKFVDLFVDILREILRQHQIAYYFVKSRASFLDVTIP